MVNAHQNLNTALVHVNVLVPLVCTSMLKAQLFERVGGAVLPMAGELSTDPATLKLMESIGKHCPNCGAFIQKNDGCNVRL